MCPEAYGIPVCKEAKSRYVGENEIEGGLEVLSLEELSSTFKRRVQCSGLDHFVDVPLHMTEYLHGHVNYVDSPVCCKIINGTCIILRIFVVNFGNVAEVQLHAIQNRLKLYSGQGECVLQRMSESIAKERGLTYSAHKGNRTPDTTTIDLSFFEN